MFPYSTSQPIKPGPAYVVQPRTALDGPKSEYATQANQTSTCGHLNTPTILLILGSWT